MAHRKVKIVAVAGKIERLRVVLDLAYRAGLVEEEHFRKIKQILSSGEASTLSSFVRQGFVKNTVAKDLAALMKLLPDTPLAQDKTTRSTSTGTSSGKYPALSKTSNESGHTIGRYKLTREIGRGGMGIVYEAYDPALERTVALKTLIDGVGETEQERFLREARLAASLHHSGIVPVYEIGCEKGIHYFTMEIVNGIPLSQEFKERRLPFKKRLEIIQKVAEALEYAHSMGVIHRDIKPGNILLDADSDPKLTDFGLAREVDTEEQLTLSGVLLGTPSYMSPEQTLGKEGETDAKTDIYSLGAILYESFTGRPPFTGASLAECLQSIRNQEPIPPQQLEPALPKELESVCLKCLEKEPRKRYRSAAELAADIGRYLNGEPVLARPIRWPAKLLRKVKRHKTIVTALLGFLLLSLTLIVFYNIYQNRQQMKKIQELIEEANNAYKDDHYNKAKNYLGEALRIDPDHATAIENLNRIENEIKNLILKGKDEEKGGRWQEAIRCYRQASQKDPGCEEAIKRLEFAKAKQDKDNMDKLIEKENALRRLESEKKQRRAKAMIPYEHALEVYHNPRLKRSDLLRCANTLSKAIEEDSEFAEAYFQRGRVFHRLSYIDKAMSDYQKCIQLNERLYNPRYYQAKILWENEEPQYSGPTTSESKEKYRTLFLAFFLYKSAFKGEEDKFLKALELCNQVSENYPLFSEAYFLRALIYKALSDIRLPESMKTCPYPIEQAFQAVNRGLELDPCDGEGYYQRGILNLLLDETSEALDDFNKAIEFGFNKKQTYYYRMLSYLNLDMKALALDDLKLILECWPDDKNNYKCYILRAIIYYLNSNIENSEQDINEGMRLASQDLKEDALEIELFYILRAILYTKKSNYPKAIENIQNLFKIMQKKSQFEDISKLTKLLPKENSLKILSAFQDPFTANFKDKEFIIQSFNVLSEQSENKQRKSRFEGLTIANLLRLLQSNIQQDKDLSQKINSLCEKASLPCSIQMLLLIYSDSMTVEMEERLFHKKGLSSSHSYYNRAIACYRKKRMAEAQSDLEYALHLNSNSPKGHYALATVFSLSGKKDLSIFHLHAALELGWENTKSALEDPDFSGLWKDDNFIKLFVNEQWKKKPLLDIDKDVDTWIKQGKGEEALYLIRAYENQEDEKVEQLIKEVDKKAFQAISKEISDAILSENDEKVQILTMQVKHLFSSVWQNELEDTMSGYYINRADNRTSKGREEDALKDYQEALKWNPNHWLVYVKRGDLYFKLNRYDEAILDWQEARILNPMTKDLEKKIQEAKSKVKK